MSVRFARDVIAEFSDTGIVPDRLAAAPDTAERRELESVLDLVRTLRIILAPVEPSAEFAALLRAELMAATFAASRTGGRSVLRVVIGAVAVSSLVSAAALYVYSRSRPPRRAA